ncbi:hypothetical protein niasHT_027490 [Heterodera trifolii]|uniref:Uncharacterized protein n=1 Tax=Heterodera trifolii TaxID=157864 RepID=A0ABD2JMS9_9BILA
MSQQLALIMFVIALQIGFAEGGFFSAVTDFFDNVGQTIEKAWNDVKEPLLDAGAIYLATLSSVASVTVRGFIVLVIEKTVNNPHGTGTEFACGPNTNAIFKGAAKFQIEFALGCAAKRDVLHQCCVTHDACYGICGKTQQNCDEVFCKCLIEGTSFFECGPTARTFCVLVKKFGKEAFDAGQEESCKPCEEVKRQCDGERDACFLVCGNKQDHCSSVHEKCFKKRDRVDCHGVDKLDPTTDMVRYVGMQVKACKKQKKTFKQIPSDELVVPPNATTTALTAVPMP